MCLAVPGRVLSRAEDEAGLALAQVDFGGVRREVCLSFVPEAEPGDWVLVHVGFALRVVDEAVAAEALEALAGPGGRPS